MGMPLAGFGLALAGRLQPGPLPLRNHRLLAIHAQAVCAEPAGETTAGQTAGRGASAGTERPSREVFREQTDFLVVGAGIVGLSITRELARRYAGARVLILEKEQEVAFHASGRNSGVLHAGFYYTADSLKACFTQAGNRLLTDYCLEHGLPINRCGKVVVAADESEVEGIRELKRRGDRNGVDLRLIDSRELSQIEPNARTVEIARFSPTTSTVDPKRKEDAWRKNSRPS